MNLLKSTLYLTLALLWLFELFLIGDYCHLYGGRTQSALFEESTSSLQAGIFADHAWQKSDYSDMVAFVQVNSPTIHERGEVVASASEGEAPVYPSQEVMVEGPVVVCVHSPCCSSIRVCPYVSANAGKGRGYDRNYNTVGVYLSPGGECCRCLPFFDARVHCFTDCRLAANFGAGVRYLTCCGDVYGAHLYYDYREGCYDGFHQMGVGMEVFTRCFDFRLNTYFPITRRGCGKKCVFEYEGGFVMCCRPCQLSMKGADAEIAKNLFGCGCFCVNAGIGPYYIADRCNKQIYGGKLRLTAKYNNTIFLDLFGTYDNFFCEKLYGKLTISIPFDYLCPQKGRCLGCFSCPTERNCCCKLDPCCYPIYRNDMIILRKRCFWEWNFCDDPDCDCDHEPNDTMCNCCSSCH